MRADGTVNKRLGLTLGHYRLRLSASLNVHLFSFSLHKTQVTGQRIENSAKEKSYTETVYFIMKTAFVFPGQGSQFIGMGKSLAEKFSAARAVFDTANRALGFSLAQLCFEGPAETLQLTENMQPALLTVAVAAWRVLDEQGIQADYVAGHSLGEYAALVAAQSLGFADAVRLVRKRGQYMQEAVPVGVGAMAALLKLPEGALDAILAEAAQGEVVTAANLNSPDQVVIAGHAGAVARALDLAKSAGARRALLLPVSAPFHCPLMEPAQRRLKADLDATEFRDLAVPLVNGWQAQVIRTGSEAREGLYQQVPNPVRWTEVIQRLSSLGVGRYLEVGAGGVLTGLLRNIDNQLEGSKFGEAEDLEKVHAAIA
jgi:[acyl-carrier-protein] S-malonyltransferase